MNRSASQYLLRQHRRFRWQPILWGLSTALIVDFVLQKTSASDGLRLGTAFVFASGTALQLLFHRPSLRQTAQKLDRDLAASNRFEALAESLPRQDALAHALRDETDRFLSNQRLPSAWAWWLSLTALVALGGTYGLDVFSRRGFTPLPALSSTVKPAPQEMARFDASLSADATPGTKLDASNASVEWHNPQGTQRATSSDLIPFQAALSSQKESYDLFLKIEINGVTHSVEKIATQLPPGERWVKGQLDLSTLPSRPFDVVSYSLSMAPLSGATTDPARAQTPSQWVEIREAHEILPDRLLDGAHSDRLKAVREAKRSHLTLQSALVPPDKSLLTNDTMKAVAQKQRSLATSLDQQAKANEYYGSDSSMSAAAIATSSTARHLEAGELASTRQASLQAIAALAGAERSATDALRAHRDRVISDSEHHVLNPLNDLPHREHTAAARLEAVTSQQSQLAHALTQPSPATSQLFDQQSKAVREMESLREQTKGEPTLHDQLTSALVAAKEAQRQLNEGDLFAALEPASQAAHQLEEALSAQKAESLTRAQEALRLAQEALNRSANDVRQVAQESLGDQTRTAAARTYRVREYLQSEARHQQEYGSAAAAASLRDLENKLHDAHLDRQVRLLLDSPPEGNPLARENLAQRFETLAQESAQAQYALGEPAAGQQRALQNLADLRNELPQAAQEGAAHVRELYEKTLAEEQRLAAASGRPPQTVLRSFLEPTGSQFELTWLRPDDHLRVTPTQTVRLVARGHRSRVYRDSQLHLSISGNPPQSVASVRSPSARENLFEVDLALTSLTLQPGDFVSYTLHARLSDSDTSNAVTGTQRSVSSAAQFLYVAEKDEPVLPEKEIKEGAPRPAAAKEDVYSQQRRLFQDTAHYQHQISVENNRAAAPLDPLNLARRQLDIRRDAFREIQATERDSEKLQIWNEVFRLMSLARHQLAAYEISHAMSAQHQALVLMAPLFRETRRLDFELQSDRSRNLSSPSSGASSSLSHARAPAPASPLQSASSRLRPGSAQHDQPFNAQIHTSVPPPPGRGPALEKLYQFTAELAPRVSGLIQETQATLPTEARAHILRTSSSHEAPPAYQPAVSQYFQALSSEVAPKLESTPPQ
ncbi:MAG TPA: hypothetical protein PLN52_01240 [Opitutaceae bacterium]|nr:hypothetical protein [Opitutaceae bacterium]